MNTQAYTLTNDTVRQIIKPYQKNGTKKEIASVMLFDDANTSSTAKEVKGAQSTASSVSFSTHDIFQTLADSDTTHQKGVIFHNHIQDLHHANTHSEQDEHQHRENKRNYAQGPLQYMGSGLVSVSSAGNFHIKFRESHTDELATILHNNVQAQEVVFNKQGKMVGYNSTTTLNPNDNTINTRAYTSI
ncbi:MAG: hypothetical protein WC004_02550 [Candidatus Absconditabacterales bacterium]